MIFLNRFTDKKCIELIDSKLFPPHWNRAHNYAAADAAADAAAAVAAAVGR